MARRDARDMTVEEFDDWTAARPRIEAVAEARTRRAGRACRWCR